MKPERCRRIEPSRRAAAGPAGGARRKPRARLPVLVAGVLLVLAGCFAPKPQETVQAWRPLGTGGPTLAEALAASPGRKQVVWESYAADQGGGSLVRASVEYWPAGADATCPPPAAGSRRAVRLFLLLEFTVSPARAVTCSGARAQVYTAKGSFEEYPLSLGVMADLMAGAFPLPCADLDLPDYL